MLDKFYEKPYYLITYFSIWAIGIWLANSFLIPSYQESWWLVIAIIVLLGSMRFDAMFAAFLVAIFLSPNPYESALLALQFLPLTFVIGVSSACFIHNASHDQFKPRWLNAIVGESVGLLLRTNYAGWKLVHHFHHRFTDNPVKDPHSPGAMSFWAYTNTMQKRIVDYLDARHMEHHQLHKAIYVLTAIIGALAISGIPLFWILVFKPTLFAAIWMPMLLSGWWIFYVINYYNHPVNEEGKNEPANLDSKWWHKLTNLVGFGVLYHKNHHKSARQFNPKNC